MADQQLFITGRIVGPEPSAHKHAGAHQCCHSPAPQPGVKRKAEPLKPGSQRTPVRILQMDCPTEEGMIRKKLADMAVVEQLEFNLLQRILTVDHQPEGLPAILAALRALGFEPDLVDPQAPNSAADAPAKPWWPLALAALAGLGAEAAHWLGGPDWLAALLALCAIALCGPNTYKKGWLAIRNGTMNINALMSIAVTGALLIGQWPEAAMVMVLFTLAELIEARSLDRARNAIEGLVQTVPATATLAQPDGSWQEVSADSVPIDSLVRVKPGERFALDGMVVAGQSSVNQAAITGESLPVEKSSGDTVFAGTLNQAGSLDYRVTGIAGDTTLARIIHAISDAQAARAPTQRLVDRFARLYTPTILILALAVALVPPLLFAAPWYGWIYKALVLLVIACPCALVISTPVTIVSGLAIAARRGILIKGGVYLEKGRNLRWLALDKTGTLTQGKPQLTDTQVIADGDPEGTRSLILAASLARQSDHPVSQALAAASPAQADMLVSDFKALPGRGVRGEMDGDCWWLGNSRLVEELQFASPALNAQVDALEQQGKTLVMLIGSAGVMALFAVADTVKPSSRAAIDALHKAGIQTLMLTGDNAHSAANIGRQVGIDRVRAHLLPADKLAAVNELAAQGTVGMVGDGINDAPALARADIGFAMGALGSDTAIETADVALMDDDIGKIAEFVHLSRATHRILMQNIVLALGIKLLFLILTLAGLGTLWMAVFADVGTSLLVVANGLRLLTPLGHRRRRA